MTQSSTLDDVQARTSPRALWARRAVIALLAAVVGAAGLGLLGVHTSTATSTADGYMLTVTYARIARAGWDVPLRIQITAPQPLQGSSITVSVDRDYLNLFETQGLWPEPADESGDLDTVQWQFDGPDQSQDLTVDYDAYIQPTAQIGTGATIEVEIDDASITHVDIRTTLIP